MRFASAFVCILGLVACDPTDVLDTTVPIELHLINGDAAASQGGRTMIIVVRRDQDDVTYTLAGNTSQTITMNDYVSDTPLTFLAGAANAEPGSPPSDTKVCRTTSSGIKTVVWTPDSQGSALGQLRCLQGW